jgi:hypothetical protein
MSHIQQFAVVAVSLVIASAITMFGITTTSRATKHILFWSEFVLILGGCLIYKAAFR